MNQQVPTSDDNELYRSIMNVCILGDVKELLPLLLGGPTYENGDQNGTDSLQSYIDDAMLPIKMREEISTINFIEKQSGNTCLHHVSVRNKMDCVSVLTRCEGIAVNMQNYAKQTPLHLAVQQDNVQIVHMLLQKKARFDIPDSKDETPLSIAVAQQREACSKLMIEFGADVSVLYAKPVAEELLMEHQYDRYGFQIPKDRTQQPKLDKAAQALIQKEPERMIKWRDMLDFCHENLASARPKMWRGYPHRKLKSRVRKGIPNEIRGEAWMILSGAEIRKQNSPNAYRECLQKPSTHVKQIDLDINRCYRDNKMFQHRYSKGQVALFNVLKAYSIYNPILGYCQGMATITAMFLLYLQEEDAFWLLVSVLSAEKYGLAGCFTDGFPRLLESFFIHEKIIENFLPKLHKHIQKSSLETSMYATRWYMQNMLDILPFEVAVHIWDLYISEGRKIIFSTTLSLFKMHEDQLKKKEFDEMIRYMNRLEVSDVDMNELLRLIIKQKIKQKKLLSFEKLYAEENNIRPV